MPTSPTPGRSHVRNRVAVLLLTPAVAGAAMTAMSTTPASAAETPRTTVVHRAIVHQAKVARVIATAASKKGTPYRYGATGPTSFDCSGYTRWVFSKVGVKLPHSSSGQVKKVKRTKKPKVGDLVFFYARGGVYHVAIYAGHHQVWHAPHPGDRVRKQRIWTSRVIYGDVRGV